MTHGQAGRREIGASGIRRAQNIESTGDGPADGYGLPADRLIEFELGRRFASLRIVDGGLIPIEGFHGRGGGPMPLS